jgi:hypothetical protein
MLGNKFSTGEVDGTASKLCSMSGSDSESVEP